MKILQICCFSSNKEVSRNLPNANLRKSSFRCALSQVLAVMVKNVLLISCGMYAGFPTILIPGVSVQNSDEIFHLSEEEISWIGSLGATWVALGCLLSGVVTKPFGRKRAMQIMSLPFTACWLIYKFSTAPWHIFLALSVGGFSGGLLEGPLITYVTEITQPHLRGVLSVTAVLSMLFGHLISYLLATFLHWRTIALWSTIPSTISFCLLFFIPESPHWLIMKNKYEEARKSLAWLRGWTNFEDIEPEFQELLHIRNIKENPADDGFTSELPASEAKTARMQSIRKFTKKNFLWPFSLLTFIFFLASFTGALTVQTYAVIIFATLQVPINEYYATVILGAATCLGCLICTIVIPYLGKRITGFISMIGCGICFITVATYAYITDIKYLSFEDANSDITSALDLETYRWIPLVFLVLSAFISYSGLKAVPWILIGEVYPIEARITGSGISTATSYLLVFFSNKMFFKMVSSLTLPGTFWFYGCVSLVGFLILYFVLPETEGKTLKEISDHFSGVSKLDNKVRRRNKSNL